MKFTYTQFKKQYPNDDVCLEKIFALRYGKNEACPSCGCEFKYYRTNIKSKVKKMRGKFYSCQYCAHQIFPLAGTIFEQTTTPLTLWFHAIYLFTATRNGVAATELQRQLGVTYKTAWRMAHHIRMLMANKKAEKLTGIVEADETYIGGLNRNKQKSKRTKGLNGHVNMKPVFAMLSRDGKIYIKILKGNKANGAILKPLIRENLDEGATLVTDGFGAYHNLSAEYHHEILNHEKEEYVRAQYHTNTIEGFWSQLKRTIKGTHISVSQKHLDKYAAECAFRYMMRNNPDMFGVILGNVSAS